MNMQLNDAANYTASLGFNLTNEWLEDWIIKMASNKSTDNSGIYVILEFEVQDGISAAVIENEREQKIDALENRRYIILSKIQQLNKETHEKIKVLQQKAENSNKKWLYFNNIKKLNEALEPKKEVLRQKLERNRQKIDKWEKYYHNKLGGLLIEKKLNTFLFRFRNGKSSLVESFFEEI